jgi:hypothetical protein
MRLRRIAAALVVATCVLTPSCRYNNPNAARSSESPTPPPPPPTVAVAALDGLLLTPDQIDATMGAKGMAVKGATATQMNDDSRYVEDADCQVMSQAANAPVYAGSGWTAYRGQQLQEPGDSHDHYLYQNVVSFPSADKAAAFVATSAQRWLACSNRRYLAHNVAPQNDIWWSVGPVENSNGMLSVIKKDEAVPGWACQRALTAANNVAIDINACAYTEGGNFGVNIAQQIAAKVRSASPRKPR